MIILAASVLVGCGSSPLGSAAGGSAGDGGGGGGGKVEFVNMCSAARAQLIGAIDTVSTGDVKVLSVGSGVTTLYVNATAGGANGAATNPWVFVSLDNTAKVAVTDVTALESLGWDLAFKRAIIYTNDGDGGPGKGGAMLLNADFANVSSADIAGVTFIDETFFDSECRATVDITGQVYTSFADWYSYDTNTHVLTPGPGTWLVRGATGRYFKLQFEDYYATPSGGMGTVGGAYVLKIEAL
jgi:hypothetical protein